MTPQLVMYLPECFPSLHPRKATLPLLYKVSPTDSSSRVQNLLGMAFGRAGGQEITYSNRADVGIYFAVGKGAQSDHLA